MKKFFTSVSMQPERSDLGVFQYHAPDNSRLQMDEAVSYPILTAVNGYAVPGEPFRVIAVGSPECPQRNRKALEDQLAALCERRGLCLPAVEYVQTPPDDQVVSHMATFQKLLDYVDDDDELFCCMTFGTKPQSQTLLLAIQYAYRVKRNASISCILYGHVTRTAEGSRGTVYDMTALTQLDEIVHLLAQRGVRDPRAALEGLLSL